MCLPSQYSQNQLFFVPLSFLVTQHPKLKVLFPAPRWVVEEVLTRRVSTILSNQSTHPHQARPRPTLQPAQTLRPRPRTQTPRPTTPTPRPPTPPLSSTPTSLEEEGAPKVWLISGTPPAPNSEGLLRERISGAPLRELLGTISELADLPAPPYYTIHHSTS